MSGQPTSARNSSSGLICDSGGRNHKRNVVRQACHGVSDDLVFREGGRKEGGGVGGALIAADRVLGNAGGWGRWKILPFTEKDECDVQGLEVQCLRY